MDRDRDWDRNRDRIRDRDRDLDRRDDRLVGDGILEKRLRHTDTVILTA